MKLWKTNLKTMSNQANDQIRETLETTIKENLEIPAYIRRDAQLALNKDDFETVIDLLSKNYEPKKFKTEVVCAKCGKHWLHGIEHGPGELWICPD